MTVQFLFSNNKSGPRYFKLYNFSIRWSLSQNSVPDSSQSTLLKRRRHFHSSPLLHILVPRCPAAITSLEKNMMHCSHLRWGLVPSLWMTIVSLTWRCMKFIRGLGWLAALSYQPSKRQLVVVSVYGKAMRYYDGVIWSGADGTASRPEKPCCVYLLLAKDAAEISKP